MDGKLISTILKFRAAVKLVGVSATFRGDAGIKKINSMINAQFLKTPVQLQDRELQLEVFGKVKDVPIKTTQLIQEKIK